MASISRRDLLGLMGASTAGLLLSGSNGGRPAHARDAITNFNRRPRAFTVTKVITDPDEAWPMIAATSPRLMEEAIARYDLISRQGGWPRVPRRLIAGSKHGAVRLLRRRLAMEGYLPADAVSSKRYDRQVAAAVFRFQKNMGLRPTGHVDQPTLKALNVPVEVRLETLLANLPRVEWAIQGVAPRYIIVNIPAAQLETVELGRVYSRHNVIVGMPDRPSPSLISRVSELNFNPYWNAPLSIVIKDIIPKARKDPDFLKRMRIRVFDGYGGPEVDPATIDWDNIDPKRYHFRQDPGEGNAMASVKINFPNRYAVYLHDTPTPQLFTESARYFSSGCVRVEKVHILTEWILRDTPGWDRARIEQVVKSRERIDVKVVNPPSLIIAYLTAWVTGDGFTHFREDIYRLDGTGFVHGQPQPVTDVAGVPG